MSAETYCGKVTEEERNEIEKLFVRKTALLELFQTIGKNETVMERFYEKVLDDLGHTTVAFDKWWNTTAKKYKWEGIDGAKWRIDFQTCEVYLVKPQQPQ